MLAGASTSLAGSLIGGAARRRSCSFVCLSFTNSGRIRLDPALLLQIGPDLGHLVTEDVTAECHILEWASGGCGWPRLLAGGLNSSGGLLQKLLEPELVQGGGVEAAGAVSRDWDKASLCHDGVRWSGDGTPRDDAHSSAHLTLQHQHVGRGSPEARRRRRARGHRGRIC